MRILDMKKEISKHIIGQEYMVDRVILGILLGGHILIEGLPGLAKSLTINVISKMMGLDFSRIQFTPDLLPSDILGTEIYLQKSGEFLVKKGPIFSNIILADEINRAPAKVQSALLEAMQERQVTIGCETYRLDDLFVVLATQNPLEQDGTYPLPEAQQDRFMLKLSVNYPNRSEELAILNIQESKSIPTLLQKSDILKIRREIESIHIEDKVKEYIVDIVLKSREPSKYVICGASPRASIALLKASKGVAYLNGRDYVIPSDVKAIARDVLRHRVVLNYEAEADNISSVRVIDNILNLVRMP